jgi:hypothetical protein
MDKTKLIKFTDFHCKVCNKYYLSYQSLWNHNNKFHNTNVSTNIPCVSNNIPIVSNIIPTVNNIKADQQLKINNNESKLHCSICNKQFSSTQNRWKHENRVCKNKLDNSNKINDEIKNKELELQITKEKNLLLKQEEKILKLKLKLEKSEIIDNVTLRQLNKKLMERNNLIKKSMINSNINSNNTNNVQNNNVVNNTFQLVGFGKEEIVDLLTLSEKKQILNARMGCLEKLIEIVHCGNYNQFKNIIVTNMKDGLVYKYVDSVGQFKLSTKSEAINHLVDCRFDDIQVIYNELINYNKIDERTKNLIEKFINNFQDPNKKFYDMDNKEYPSFKHYKINEVKILLYNNQDKITNDIALLLTATDDPPNDLSKNNEVII